VKGALTMISYRRKGDESLTEKESDMGGPNWIEILTTTRLEVRFTWRFEGLLGEFPISSRWIFNSFPSIEILRDLRKRFLCNVTRKYHPNDVGWYLARDSRSRSTMKIWEAGIWNSGPRNRQPFQ
jgi:hypothetical protein